MGTATQLRAVSSLTSHQYSCDVYLPVADSMRVLGVTLDHRLTFDNHASAVAQSCNYHARTIRHICHLLMLDLAQTHACGLILSRIDYCNSVLYGAPSRSSSKSRKMWRISFYKASMVRRQLAASDALAACWTAHQLQAGCADVQDSADVISAVSEPAHLGAHQRMQHSIIMHPTAILANIIRQAIVQHCCAPDSELTATGCVKLRLSLSNPDLKFMFSTAFC